MKLLCPGAKAIVRWDRERTRQSARPPPTPRCVGLAVATDPERTIRPARPAFISVRGQPGAIRGAPVAADRCRSGRRRECVLEDARAHCGRPASIGVSEPPQLAMSRRIARSPRPACRPRRRLIVRSCSVAMGFGLRRRRPRAHDQRRAPRRACWIAWRGALCDLGSRGLLATRRGTLRTRPGRPYARIRQRRGTMRFVLLVASRAQARISRAPLPSRLSLGASSVPSEAAPQHPTDRSWYELAKSFQLVLFRPLSAVLALLYE